MFWPETLRTPSKVNCRMSLPIETRTGSCSGTVIVVSSTVGASSVTVCGAKGKVTVVDPCVICQLIYSTLFISPFLYMASQMPLLTASRVCLSEADPVMPPLIVMLGEEIFTLLVPEPPLTFTLPARPCRLLPKCVGFMCKLIAKRDALRNLFVEFFCSWCRMRKT